MSNDLNPTRGHDALAELYDAMRVYQEQAGIVSVRAINAISRKIAADAEFLREFGSLAGSVQQEPKAMAVEEPAPEPQRVEPPPIPNGPASGGHYGPTGTAEDWQEEMARRRREALTREEDYE